MCECAFYQIINRKSPAHIIYENGQLISFLDIEPINEEIAERIRKKLESSL